MESHDRQRLLARHIMMMMFKINSEKANVKNDHVVSILRSISGASVRLANVLSEVKSTQY